MQSCDRIAAIIPLCRDSHHGSSSLPEGSQLQQLTPQQNGAFAHRAGPALPSYLALHHAGFSVPRLSPNERWALTPPFHPYRGISIPRRLAGFPARCHRAPFHRRFIFCGTFREPHRTLARTLQLPWRYQARCPSVTDLATGNLGVRTFLPSSVISTGTSDHPAHPLALIIPRIFTCDFETCERSSNEFTRADGTSPTHPRIRVRDAGRRGAGDR